METFQHDICRFLAVLALASLRRKVGISRVMHLATWSHHNSIRLNQALREMFMTKLINSYLYNVTLIDAHDDLQALEYLDLFKREGGKKSQFTNFIQHHKGDR